MKCYFCKFCKYKDEYNIDLDKKTKNNFVKIKNKKKQVLMNIMLLKKKILTIYLIGKTMILIFK